MSSRLTEARRPASNPTSGEKQSWGLTLACPPLNQTLPLPELLLVVPGDAQALCPPGWFCAGPPSLQTAWPAQGQVSKRGDNSTGRLWRWQARGWGQGSGQTNRGLLACWATIRKPDHIRPRSSQALCAPKGRERKPCLACSTLVNAAGKQLAICDHLPGPQPAVQSFPHFRASSSVWGGAVSADGSRTLPGLNALNPRRASSQGPQQEEEGGEASHPGPEGAPSPSPQLRSHCYF